MNISNLTIKSYRNLVEVSIDFEEDCTVLFGENNSGKSNLLDALFAALRVNRTLRQGAFDLHDYHLATATSMAGDSGPIEITVTLAERSPKEWSDDVLSDFNDVLVYDPTSKINSVILRVKSIARGEGREEEYDWAFCNSDGTDKGARKYISQLNTLQRLRPFFRLGALRDAEREFTNRSTFFSPFVNDPTFSEPVRVELSNTLATVNAMVLQTHEAFTTLRDSLASGAQVVTGETYVQIEAVPSRLSDLLAHTQISMNSKGKAALPIERHGSGSQSIAVVSLFNAYVRSKLASRYDETSRAILTLEEPESHLHPSAVRMLWEHVRTLDAQMVITTHSGDLLGEVPLRSLRRVHQTPTGCSVTKVDLKKLTFAQQRQLEYGIQASRGELLFARGWLLVEGRTELVGVKQLASVLGIDLHGAAVRVVECQQYGGPAPFINLADQLGIAWHCLCDGDEQGVTYVTAAETALDGRSRTDHITAFALKNIEAYLASVGFEAIYEGHVPPEKKPIPGAVGSDEYCNHIGEHIINSHKERAIREVCLAVKADPRRAPPLLLDAMRAIARTANP